MSTLTSIVPKSRFRRVSKGGAFSASRFNASLEELTQEIQELQAIHNDLIVPLLGALPAGADDDEFPSIGEAIDALANGISGDQIWSDNTATSESDDIFWSTTDARKLTIKETLIALADRINSNFATVQDLIEDVDAGVSSYTRNYIGLTAFDDSLSSAASSMDGRLGQAQLNLRQLKADAFGSPYSLDADGAPNLSYPLQQLVDAILDKHGGAAYKSGLTYATTVTLTNPSVNTGDLTLTSLIPPTWVDKILPVTSTLGRAAPVNNLENEIKRLRFELARLKSPTAQWSNDGGIAPAYNPAVTSLGAHIHEFGTGTPSADNPHGTSIDDIDGWVGDAREAILGFTGMDDMTDGTPNYSSHGPTSFVNDGDSLEQAIQTLDNQLSFGTSNIVVYHKDMPDMNSGAGGNDVDYIGWAPLACELISCRVYMDTKNTVGAYVLTLLNGVGDSMLDGASFNMNTLTSGVVTDVPLSAYPNRLELAQAEKWTLNLASANAGFNGVGVYFELIFQLV